MICKKCINTTNNPTIEIGDDGLCNVCRDYNQHYDAKLLKKELDKLLLMRKNNGEIDCLSALSGGKDSSAMLYSVKELGFKPLAFTFKIGYNILNDQIKSTISKVCNNIGVSHEYIDMHPYITSEDKECFKQTADFYDAPINEKTIENFRNIYLEGRKHYSTKDKTIMPFIRPCQICRKIAIRAYYEEALKRNVRIVFVGINEWAGLSNNSYTAIRELKPFAEKPSVFIVHFPFLIHRKLADLNQILTKIGWQRSVTDNQVDTGGRACMLARTAELKSTDILGFNIDETRLSREITVGFIDRETALNALKHYKRPVNKSMKEILKESGVL